MAGVQASFWMHWFPTSLILRAFFTSAISDRNFVCGSYLFALPFNVFSSTAVRIFLNLDTLLRSPNGQSSMAHVKTGLGLFGSALLVALGLCVSFWVGIAPVWSFDWQKAGFLFALIRQHRNMKKATELQHENG